MQVILDSSFARPGSAPIWGGKKGDFRDWTILKYTRLVHKLKLRQDLEVKIESDLRRLTGKVFHSVVAATLEDLSPKDFFTFPAGCITIIP